MAERRKKWIAEAIHSGKKVLGVCLGAQLIAQVLGARVYKNAQKEIGWWPVIGTPEASKNSAFSSFKGVSEVFHWHGDTFDLPSGCTLAAKSEACLNQAFFYGDHVAGLQFHIESTPESVRLLADHGADEINTSSPFIQTKEEILGRANQFRNISEMLNLFLDGFMLNRKLSYEN